MSKNNIISLSTGTRLKEGGAPPEIIAALELALKRAKKGEVVGFGIVEVTPSGDIITHWLTSNRCGHTLLAGCEYLKHSILTSKE